MNYLSICSGIEAATTAWHHLGFKPLGFSEIESFPSAVLAHHYPEVKNFGDMTKHKEWTLHDRIDLLVGGTPCQAFSVAGARRGLEDERGNLTLTFCNIADQFNPEFTLWENVPGVCSDRTNAFGCLLSGLAGFDEVLKSADGKWRGSGMVVGRRRRVAWVTLDAQFFGVPQRRRRIFVLAVDAQSVADSPDKCPSKILAIGQSLRRDTPSRRKEGEIAPTTPSRSSAGGGLGTDFDLDGGLQVCYPLNTQIITRGGAMGEGTGFGMAESGEPSYTLQAGHSHAVAFQQNTRDEVRLIRGEGLLPGALAAQPGMKQQNYIVEGFTPSSHGDNRRGLGTLRASGGDLGGGSEQLITIMAHGQANAEILSDGGSPSLTCNHEAPIVVHGTQDPCTSDIAFAQGMDNGGENVIAFQQNASGDVFTNKMAGTIGTNQNASGRNTQMLATSMQVRRLTPEECEALQGFPRGYTNIPWRKKPDSPDGPRYKALGNSMAVPVMRWIGERISEVVKRFSCGQPVATSQPTQQFQWR